MGRTPELRIDRLERIAGLFVKAGLRRRRDLRRMDEKLNILVTHQIQNEERFARSEKRLAKLAARTDEKFAEVARLQTVTERKFAEVAKLQTVTEHKFAEVAEFQAVTDRRFVELVQILRQGQNGNSLTDNS
jgi:hypothetical protein